jgi:hypothetical protein
LNLVAGQVVKIGTEEAREAFQFVECILCLEDLCIELESGMGRIYSGTATGSLFGFYRVWRRISAEEKFWISASGRCNKSALMDVSFQYWQAIKVRPDPTYQ